MEQQCPYVTTASFRWGIWTPFLIIGKGPSDQIPIDHTFIILWQEIHFIGTIIRDHHFQNRADFTGKAEDSQGFPAEAAAAGRM